MAEMTTAMTTMEMEERIPPADRPPPDLENPAQLIEDPEWEENSSKMDDPESTTTATISPAAKDGEFKKSKSKSSNGSKKINIEPLTPSVEISSESTPPSVTRREEEALKKLQLRNKISGTYFFVVAVIAISLWATQSRAMIVAFVVGLFGAFVTAWANAANDICNSVGTSVGCGALTLAQAAIFGGFFEIFGAMTMGPFMSKSIVKGVITTSDYEETPEMYAWLMVSVLIGCGTTKLIATFYGYPVSATHGIIAGLTGCGVAAKGWDSVNWPKLKITCIGWVAAPFAGGMIAMLVYASVHFLIYKAGDPERAARKLQPFYMWLCFTVSALVILLKGPKGLKMDEGSEALAVAVAGSIGALCVPFYYLVMSKRTLLFGSAEEYLPEPPISTMMSSNKGDLKQKKRLSKAQRVRRAASRGFDSISNIFGLIDNWNEDNDSLSERRKDILSPSDQSADEPTTISTLDSSSHDQDMSYQLEDAQVRLEVVDENKMMSTQPITAPILEPTTLSTPSSSHNNPVMTGANGSSASPTSNKNKSRTRPRTAGDPGEPAFVPLLIIAAFTSAYAHGGNDIGNSVGPLAAILMVKETGAVETTPDIPISVLLYGAIGFICGFMTMGKFTIRTVANSLMILTPSRSFAIQIGAALAVLISSVFGLPVSTSHCLVGSVVGIGLLEKHVMQTGEVNNRMLMRIVASWVITIPAAMTVSLLCYTAGEKYYRG